MNKYIVLLLILFISCSSNRIELKPDKAVPTWLTGPTRFAPRDLNGFEKVHPFFDLVPFASSKDNTINFVMTSLEGSDIVYDIDLNTGNLYTKQLLCEQDDIWKNYTAKTNRMPFHLGFVPRLLNNLGEPQQIIVFGSKEKFLPFTTEPIHSQRVKVIGGVYYDYCEEYPCFQKRSWKSSIVLVAVNPNDYTFSNVNKMHELKTKINWPKAKSFLENYQGRFFAVDKNHPSYRVSGEMSATDAVKRVFKFGHYFQFNEMKSMMTSCYKLYDWMAESAKILYNKKFKQKTIQEIRKELEGGVRKEKKKRSRLSKKVYTSFASFFKYFYANYGSEFLTCQRFVNPANHQSDMGMLLFFRYMSGFMLMEDIGLAYTCSNKAWGLNGRSLGGRQAVDLVESKYRCSTHALNKSFDLITPYLVGLRARQKTHLRFITYDYGSKGTNKPIFNWVKSTGKRQNCLDANPEDKLFNERELISKDLKWNYFPDVGNSVKIIEGATIK